jgi:hypothetical protein
MKPITTFIILFFILFLFSCDNEPVETITISAEDAIMVDSNLYGNIERSANNNLVCIDFNYPFTLNVFDENLEFVEFQILNNDLEFSNLLDEINEMYSISLSYPISYINEDGNSIEISNNEELKDKLDECIELETIRYCNGLLTTQQCIWRVIGDDNTDGLYEDAFFNINSSGLVAFNVNDQITFGSWITLFIEDELHINMNFNGDDLIANDWNFDWNIIIVDENNMTLESNGIIRTISRECFEDSDNCFQYIFEQCSIEEDTSFSLFDLSSISDCIGINDELLNSEISYHLSINDAENNTNVIDSPFTNTENPQNLQVRIENNETSEISFTEIQLVVYDCEN